MTGYLSDLEYDEFGHPIAHIDEPDPCPVCCGTGANPLSDNLNWLPCTQCGGTGQARRPESPIPF